LIARDAWNSNNKEGLTMPRGKSTMPPLLQAADQFRRSEVRVRDCTRALEKAQKARAAAEAAYLDLVSKSLAARQQPASAGEGGTTTEST
jgi:hypothetical protein